MSRPSHSNEIFFVAGESSADLHGARLLAELKDRIPDVKCFGVGGTKLREAGMEICLDASALNVVGISDWIHKLPEVLRGYRHIKRTVKERMPSCAVLIDLPDFNLRMAKHLKSLGIPVVYYISPQVWAWRKYRVRQIQERVDRMLVVLPFEKKFYDKHGVDVRFVGHPLLEERESRKSYRDQKSVLESPCIALLPGSRTSELHFHLPMLKELRSSLIETFPTARFLVPVALTLDFEAVSKEFAGENTRFFRGDAENVLKEADIALVASGTATLETALTGTPFALFYRLSPSSAFIARHVARYKGFYGLPNLLHGKEVVREFFQEEASAAELKAEATRLILDERYRKGVADKLRQCRDMLGSSGASARAAEEVESVLSGARQKVTEHDGVRAQKNPLPA